MGISNLSAEIIKIQNSKELENVDCSGIDDEFFGVKEIRTICIGVFLWIFMNQI